MIYPCIYNNLYPIKKCRFHCLLCCFFHSEKSEILGFSYLLWRVIWNSCNSSSKNTSFVVIGAAVIVSTARMVISTNDMSVTLYNLSMTLIYLICVILSVIIITSVSLASPNKGMLYGFWTNLSIHVPRGESAWFVRLEEPFVLKRTYERLVQTNRPIWLIMCFQNWKRPQFRGHWQLPWIRE